MAPSQDNEPRQEDLAYPLPAFFFKIQFGDFGADSDTSFQEVRGIGAELETEDVLEGGENRYVYRLPKSMKHPQLELKRCVAKPDSKLVEWCKQTLENGFASGITPQLVTVNLLDYKEKVAAGWQFTNAYPTKWEVDDFKSTKNEVVIETIVLSYAYSSRIS